jgi:hypothetical protein
MVVTKTGFYLYLGAKYTKCRLSQTGHSGKVPGPWKRMKENSFEKLCGGSNNKDDWFHLPPHMLSPLFPVLDLPLIISSPS